MTRFFSKGFSLLPRRRSSLLLLPVLLIFLGALVGVIWVNYQFAQENPGGNDFLPRWSGARLYLTNGWSPYSDQTTRAIQERFYGRPARPDEDQALFVYPLYSLWVFAPYALIGDFTLARALWMTTLEVSLVLIAALSLKLTDWRLHGLALVGLLLFAELWYHGVRPAINGNATVLCALFSTAALLCIRDRRDATAGALLALASIKPQIVALLLPFVLVWAVSQRRWRLLGGTIGSLVVLGMSAMLLIPDWTLQNLRQVTAYPGYSGAGTPGVIFSEWWPEVGYPLGWLLTIVLATLLLREWWAAWGKEARWFLWTASLTLVLTQWIGIQTDPTNYTVLFLPLVLVCAFWEQGWGRRGRLIAFASMLVLFVGLWALFLGTVKYGAQAQQHPVMFFPLPLFLLVGLYSVRRWTIRSSGEDDRGTP